MRSQADSLRRINSSITISRLESSNSNMKRKSVKMTK